MQWRVCSMAGAFGGARLFGRHVPSTCRLRYPGMRWQVTEGVNVRIGTISPTLGNLTSDGMKATGEIHGLPRSLSIHAKITPKAQQRDPCSCISSDSSLPPNYKSHTQGVHPCSPTLDQHLMSNCIILYRFLRIQRRNGMVRLILV